MLQTGCMVHKGCGLASLALANRVVASTSLRSLKRGHKVDQPAALPIESLTPLGSLPAGRQKESSFMCRRSAFLSGHGRRWRRRRRRLADGSAAGESTLCPRFGKASAFSKTQPHRESDSQHSQSPGGSLRMLFAAHRLGQRSGARPTTFIPIHPGGRVANHQPQ